MVELLVLLVVVEIFVVEGERIVLLAGIESGASAKGDGSEKGESIAIYERSVSLDYTNISKPKVN